MGIQQTGSEHDVNNLDQMMSRVTDRYEPDHDYERADDEPGHPMHSDPLCRACGRSATSYRHF